MVGLKKCPTKAELETVPVLNLSSHSLHRVCNIYIYFFKDNEPEADLPSRRSVRHLYHACETYYRCTYTPPGYYSIAADELTVNAPRCSGEESW
jgi:hypothetical protein